MSSMPFEEMVPISMHEETFGHGPLSTTKKYERYVHETPEKVIHLVKETETSEILITPDTVMAPMGVPMNWQWEIESATTVIFNKATSRFESELHRARKVERAGCLTAHGMQFTADVITETRTVVYPTQWRTIITRDSPEGRLTTTSETTAQGSNTSEIFTSAAH